MEGPTTLCPMKNYTAITTAYLAVSGLEKYKLTDQCGQQRTVCLTTKEVKALRARGQRVT
jgi:hypothetical protein